MSFDTLKELAAEMRASEWGFATEWADRIEFMVAWSELYHASHRLAGRVRSIAVMPGELQTLNRAVIDALDAIDKVSREPTYTLTEAGAAALKDRK